MRIVESEALIVSLFGKSSKIDSRILTSEFPVLFTSTEYCEEYSHKLRRDFELFASKLRLLDNMLVPSIVLLFETISILSDSI